MAARNEYLGGRGVTFARAEVGQFYLPVSSDQDVLWLYVSMENAFLVQEGSRLEDVVADSPDLLQIEEGLFVLVKLV